MAEVKCRDCGKDIVTPTAIRCNHCAKKEVWSRPGYRERQSKAHLGNIPTNIDELVAYSKMPLQNYV